MNTQAFWLLVTIARCFSERQMSAPVLLFVGMCNSGHPLLPRRTELCEDRGSPFKHLFQPSLPAYLRISAVS